MNKKTIDFLYVILIISLIAFMIWMVFWLKSESKDCTINPVKYFYEKNPEINCMCMKNGELVQGLGNERGYDIQP